MRRRIATLVIVLLSALAPRSARPVAMAAGAADSSIYLPIVMRQVCDLNAYETNIAERMRLDPQQQRLTLECDPILARVARERALDMATRHYFGHTNPDGYGPNYLVRQAGYPLPSWYDASPAGNNIESIASGYSTPDAVWQGWMNSPAHRTHLLGLVPFFAEQIDYGIGYVYDPASDYGHYWVVITARKEP